MRERVFIFLVVLLLRFNGEIFAQTERPFALSGESIFDTKSQKSGWSYFRKNYLYSLPQAELSIAKASSTFHLSVIDGNRWTFGITPHAIGFFCQKELQLDKITPIPIRFRLGSMNYVDYMEQKPNAIKPQ